MSVAAEDAFVWNFQCMHAHSRTFTSELHSDVASARVSVCAQMIQRMHNV